MKLRQEEIQIYNKFTYEGLKLVPTIEKNTNHDEFIDALLEIYKELPKPLRGNHFLFVFEIFFVQDFSFCSWFFKLF